MIDSDEIHARLLAGPGSTAADLAFSLVAEVRRLQKENRKLRDVLEWVNVQCPSKCSGVCDAALRGDLSKVEGEDMSEKTTNAVVHPKHYNSGSIEVITAIEDWQLNFSCGNVVKYVVRAPHKGKHLEDLRKAREYLDFEIARVERLEQVALLPAKGNK